MVDFSDPQTNELKDKYEKGERILETMGRWPDLLQSYKDHFASMWPDLSVADKAAVKGIADTHLDDIIAKATEIKNAL